MRVDAYLAAMAAAGVQLAVAVELRKGWVLAVVEAGVSRCRCGGGGRGNEGGSFGSKGRDAVPLVAVHV